MREGRSEDVQVVVSRRSSTRKRNKSEIKRLLLTCLFNKTPVQSANLCCQCLSYGLDVMQIAFCRSLLLCSRQFSPSPSFSSSPRLRVPNRQRKEKENVMRKRDMSLFSFSSRFSCSLFAFCSAFLTLTILKSSLSNHRSTSVWEKEKERYSWLDTTHMFNSFDLH